MDSTRSARREPTDHPHAKLYREWLRAIEQGATGDELARYFTPDVLAIELPNLIFPAGARRDLAAILQAAVRGKDVVRDQRFEVRSILIDGDRLAAEVEWSATLCVPVGARPAGETLRSFFAAFVTFRAGRIAENRSYDCYAPADP